MPLPRYKTASRTTTAGVLLLLPVIVHLVIWNLWMHDRLAALIITAATLGYIWYFRSTKMLIVALSVGALGTLQDTYFITHGIWRYSSMHGAIIPLYVPALWAAIGCIVIGLFKFIAHITRAHPLLSYHRPRPAHHQLVATVLALTAALAALATLADTIPLLALTFLAIDIAYVTFMRSVPLALVGATVFLFGMIGEITAVSFGAWAYANGTFHGVPPFIFFGWDVIGTVIVGTYMTLDAFFLHRTHQR